MPNGDSMDLKIKGLTVIALPEDIKIKTQRIGEEEEHRRYRYTLDLNDIPKDKRWLTIEIDYIWI